MTSNAPDHPTAPGRTPPLVRLAYAQLALAALAFTAVPLLAIKKQVSPPPLQAVAAEEEVFDAEGDAALASADPFVRGEAVFGQSCAACHQANGEGIPGVFPPLAGSDYLLADPERAVGIVLHGLSGLVTVNGVSYESVMPPIPLEDADVAAVMTYVLRAWDNQGPAVDADTVAAVRAAGPKS